VSLKFFPLVWAGLWRRPARTIFTGLCITIAFLLLGLLEGVNAGFARAIEHSNREYLFTNPLARGGTPMPIGAETKIRALPGVKDINVRVYFSGSVREPATTQETAAAIATDPAKFFEMQKHNMIPATGSLAALVATRDGMIATPALLKQFGWKVGDHIVLKSWMLRTDGSPYWNFHIVGTFAPLRDPDHLWLGIIHYSYLDEGRAYNRGTVETFYTRISDPTKGTAAAAAVDAIFANSPNETRTRSGQQRAEQQAKQMGDIRFFTDAILASVLFTLAFITGNTLRQSLHDRIPEFAVLKAVGYKDVAVLVIAYAEALLLYIPFALVGLGIAYLLAPLAPRDVGAVVVSFGVASIGLICAAVLALISVALPASKLARLPVVTALGRR
jgi:putative ABC transport system permease protein